MRQIYTLISLLCITFTIAAQDNIILTNTRVPAILEGNYTPSDYLNGNEISDPRSIIAAINDKVSPDTLKKHILKMATFRNRNTGADTTSATEGMGAARRWVYDEFESYRQSTGNRLEISYLQFDQDICGMGQHRNILAILPGTDTDNHGVVLIEGHMDSRCEERCDIDCVAEGVEDNASGTALVMELARVMSQYAFKHTIVFMVTTGEEQGLLGANAFAEYCADNDIPIKAVLNNDVIGGIICGKTSSAPSCPGENHIDSTQVRLFSQGSLFSKHKQLARYIKMQYAEELFNIVSVPMALTIMSGEDRSGRGGDHIPFRQKNFAAMRFTSANEHGDGGPDNDYTDRQHTMDDILGVDTDQDGEIDSFFVDFNYLARNAVINGNAATCIAQSNPVPSFVATQGNGNVIIDIEDDNYDSYKVMVRSRENDFDTVYTHQGSDNFLFPIPPSGTTFLFVSIAGIDDNGIESCFTDEIRPTLSGASEPEQVSPSVPVQLFQNKPNPFDEATYIHYEVTGDLKGKKGRIVIRDMNGKVITTMPADLKAGYHELLYTHGYNASGTYLYSLEIDGQVVASKRMIFNN